MERKHCKKDVLLGTLRDTLFFLWRDKPLDESDLLKRTHLSQDLKTPLSSIRNSEVFPSVCNLLFNAS